MQVFTIFLFLGICFAGGVYKVTEPSWDRPYASLAKTLNIYFKLDTNLPKA